MWPRKWTVGGLRCSNDLVRELRDGVLNLVYGPAASTGDATYEDAKVHLAQPEQ
jgi:acyl-CoA reductase-like NAD-dependent aldehyde dehydrogenase